MALPIPKPQPPVPGRENNHVEIMGIAGFMTGFAVLVVSLRLWVRRFVLKTFGWDDWFIALAMLHTIGVLVCFIGTVNNGGGHHWYDLGVPEEWESMKHWQYAQVTVNITGVSIVKISVCLALLRFLKGKWYQLFLKVMIGFIVIFTIASEAPLLFECRPMYNSWAFIREPGACISNEAFVLVANINGAINIVTDATLVLLPIPTIAMLKVNVRTKASLIGVLCIGFFATGTAIVRAITGNKPIQLTDGSFTLRFYLWNSAELNAGLVAASIPPLRPLLSGWLEGTARRFRSTGAGSSSAGRSRPGALGYAGAGGLDSRPTKHGYQKQKEEQSIQLSESKQWSGKNGGRSGTGTTVMISSRSAYGLEDNSSEEGILPQQQQQQQQHGGEPAKRSSGLKGITKQTEITVHESRH
ncbi:uncharacterized protein B0I36DRAFT_313201 [Microdochium trichocladiopsis]|uniref:Rhodopsin domain-containing protein n=1 Tax=Microdochium trichocladiopsis TaxID=1682393 RepID=A0A9P9BRN8_9PEZI|nr:uncharacterized protein B0I36DRAFT_313201 [Microdochium trichocladiopsis]KAH7037045.1 hypothetical protein B0I36DRAFT_313201 [Microdochium trichocladiopsis]